MRMEVIGKWRNDSFSKGNRKNIDEQKEIGNTTEQDEIENQNIHMNNNNEQQPFGFGINKQSSQINQLNNLSDEDAETENQMIEQFAKLGDEEEKQLYFHPLIQNDIEYEINLNEQSSSNTIMKDINTINTASKIIKPKKSQGSWTELSAGKEDEELITTPQNELSPSLPEQKNENIKSEAVTGFKMQIQQPSKDKGKDLNKEKELEREREKEIQKRAELDLQRYQQNQLQQQMEQERQNQQQLLNQQLLMRIEFEIQQQLSGGYQNQMTNYGYSPQFNSNYFFSNLNNQQQIPQYINQSPSFIPQQSMIFPPHPTQSTIQQNITPGLLQQPHITPGQAQQNGLLPQPQFMQWPQQY
ncbi:MAG: hypothetical protein EZS28_016727 [Streblomastix strix]|uniref:Uncharacterized protein n=1 Tax=Streblomastix strix TaxID=222440 RepID=A0A5J4VYN8_9EUKA|nr:MAG: hypothetical protein EZS28_016727 [Streblomastix strix]